MADVYTDDAYHQAVRSMMNDMAKIFRTGRSQAVRLPKEYRFEGSEVSIRREGDNVILEPIREGDRAWANRLAGTWDEDFATAALDRPGPEMMLEGPSFD